MNVEVKSSNGISLIPMDSRLLTKRCVFIEGEINHERACEFTKKIMLLIAENSAQPIYIFINSPGGEINAGLLMYDVIQSCKTPIKTVCLGAAFSMGAILFASGKHGRLMLANSELMIHEPLLGSKVGGSTTSIKALSDSMIETRRKINEILSLHTGKSVEEIEKATEYDHYFTAKESLEFGLCDKIVTFDELMEGAYEV